MPSAEMVDNGQKSENLLFSPRFRSVAAMAGWDEEALLIASLVVEDTPDRQFKQRKRSDLQSFKTPPTNSRRKRRAQRKSPASKPPVVFLDLEDESNPKQEVEKVNKESNAGKEAETKDENNEENCKSNIVSVSTSTAASIPCMDKLRDELSCAICLEICYEPSTTPCGHSFCKKCLRSAADKCGKKCPKCRQLISNGRYCTVNTVLWNTIQLLFPQEVEARKAAAVVAATAASSAAGSNERTSPPTRSRRHRVVASLNSPESESQDRRNRNHLHRQPVRRQRAVTRELPGQDEDAALALRLQRQEFMEAFSNDGSDRRSTSNTSNRNNNSSAVARANLRAMASRAMNIRIRGHAHR